MANYLIKGDNPKGLPFEWFTASPQEASDKVRAIIRLGGVNVTVNGTPVPDHFYEMAFI